MLTSIPFATAESSDSAAHSDLANQLQTKLP
jgi:hypothetical protein